MPTYPKGTRQWAEQSLAEAQSSLKIFMSYQYLGAFEPWEVVFEPCGCNCARLDNYEDECKKGGYLCPAILDAAKQREFKNLWGAVKEFDRMLREDDLPESTETLYSAEELERGYGQGRLI